MPQHCVSTRAPPVRRCVRIARRPALAHPLYDPVAEEVPPHSLSGGHSLSATHQSDPLLHAPPSVPLPSEALNGPDGEYAVLRGEYDYEKLHAFWSRRPCEVARRFVAFASAAVRVARVWLSEEKLPPEKRTRGAFLRDVVSDLGCATVKCGQTMAERPDVIGDEAASALKLLQGNNKPFANDVAWGIIATDLRWSGPLAPGCPYKAGEVGTPLFAHLSAEPVAAASLAQVYYAKTWDGQELAIKVQRPGLLRNVALDMYVLRLALDGLRRAWGVVADLSLIADEVGRGVFRELDAHGEAANAAAFAKSLAFLGFVRAPGWAPQYSGPQGSARVLAMQWVHGRRLGDLPPPEARRFVDMAVEASVAQLIRTGLVHADPHAGNLLLDGDGNLVFLDFGLMCTVEAPIREAFASGVCHLLAGEWLALARDFQACGLVPPLFEARNPVTGKHEVCSDEFFAEGIRKAICGEADGLTRFGALATGLGGASGVFRFLCPPFIILLCRTFLTLEGMAGVVDPDFSIYVKALPYAVRRALSPETERGEAVLRETLLTESGAFRWGRLNELLQQLEQHAAAPPAASSAAAAAPPPPGDGAGMSTLTGLLGAPEGAALRRVAFDADSLALARHLTGAEGRPLRRAGMRSLASFLQAWRGARAAPQQWMAARTAEQRANDARSALRQRQAIRIICTSHLRRLLRGGVPGLFAVLRLCVTALQVGLGVAAQLISSSRQRA